MGGIDTFSGNFYPDNPAIDTAGYCSLWAERFSWDFRYTTLRLQDSPLKELAGPYVAEHPYRARLIVYA